MCLIANSFRDRVNSLYRYKIVDKEMLRTVYNTGIYCSSDRVSTVYLVQYIFENSTVKLSALCNSCEDRACCSSECILTFLYAGDNIRHEIESNSSPVSSYVLYTSLFSQPHKKNLTGCSTAGVKDHFGRQIQTPLQ